MRWKSCDLHAIICNEEILIQSVESSVDYVNCVREEKKQNIFHSFDLVLLVWVAVQINQYPNSFEENELQTNLFHRKWSEQYFRVQNSRINKTICMFPLIFGILKKTKSIWLRFLSQICYFFTVCKSVCKMCIHCQSVSIYQTWLFRILVKIHNQCLPIFCGIINSSSSGSF